MCKTQDKASITLPDFYYKKFPDITTFLQESRVNALLAVAESKLSVFETQPIGKYSNRVKGYLLTPGCIVADLCLVRENQTITNALSRVIAQTDSGMGCIIYRLDNQGHRQYLTRQYTDLSFICGKLLQVEDNKTTYKLFSLPELCFEALDQSKPGILLESHETAQQHFESLPKEVKQALQLKHNQQADNEGQGNDQQLGRGFRKKFINKKYAHTIFK